MTTTPPLQTSTESVVRTVLCPLETSNRKNERVREVVDAWQDVADYMATVMPSYDSSQWRAQENSHTRAIREEFSDSYLDDRTLRNHDAYQAGYKVAEAFDGWDSRGQPGDRPGMADDSDLGNGDYARLCSCCAIKNIIDHGPGNGFGIKIALQPYNPETFHIIGGAYQREYLEAVTDGDAEATSIELQLDGDNLRAAIAIRSDVEVLEPESCERTLAVKLAATNLYAAAVYDNESEEYVDAAVETGAEYRNHRKRLKRKRAKLGEQGDLQRLKLSRQQQKYTEHVTHRASKEIVRMAEKHAPAKIRLEELTHLREVAEPDQFDHSWPYAQIQEQIAYKAKDTGIPVEFVSAAGTRTTCRNCGADCPDAARNRERVCPDCDHVENAFLNAAMNLAAE